MSLKMGHNGICSEQRHASSPVTQPSVTDTGLHIRKRKCCRLHLLHIGNNNVRDMQLGKPSNLHKEFTIPPMVALYCILSTYLKLVAPTHSVARFLFLFYGNKTEFRQAERAAVHLLTRRMKGARVCV